MAKINKWLKPGNLEKIREWAADKENTIAIIASKMKISPSTFYNWMNEYDDFREAFDEGRRGVDEEVESSFFKMCTGYKETVKEYIKVRGGEGEELVPVEKEIYIPPSVAAQKLYLVNRMPDKYRSENAVLPQGQNDDENTGVVMLPEVENAPVIDAEIVEE